MVTEEAIDTNSNERRLVYQHKIKTGVTTVEHYGLALAAKTNLPEDTVNFAWELAELITRNQTVTVLNLTFRHIFFKINKHIFI